MEQSRRSVAGVLNEGLSCTDNISLYVYRSIFFWLTNTALVISEPIIITSIRNPASNKLQELVLLVASVMFLIQTYAESVDRRSSSIKQKLIYSTMITKPVQTRLIFYIKEFVKKGEYVLETICFLIGWIFLFILNRPGIAALRCFRMFRILWYYDVKVVKEWLNKSKRTSFAGTVQVLVKVNKFAVRSLSALAAEMFVFTKATRGGLLLMMIFFYCAFVLGMVLWLEVGSILTDDALDHTPACGNVGSCMYTMIRLSLYDGVGLDFAYRLVFVDVGLFYLCMLYLCTTSFGILNGLTGIFGTAFTMQSEQVFIDEDDDEDYESEDDKDRTISSVLGNLYGFGAPSRPRFDPNISNSNNNDGNGIGNNNATTNTTTTNNSANRGSRSFTWSDPLGENENSTLEEAARMRLNESFSTRDQENVLPYRDENSIGGSFQSNGYMQGGADWSDFRRRSNDGGGSTVGGGTSNARGSGGTQNTVTAEELRAMLHKTNSEYTVQSDNSNGPDTSYKHKRKQQQPTFPSMFTPYARGGAMDRQMANSGTKNQKKMLSDLLKNQELMMTQLLFLHQRVDKLMESQTNLEINSHTRSRIQSSDRASVDNNSNNNSNTNTPRRSGNFNFINIFSRTDSSDSVLSATRKNSLFSGFPGLNRSSVRTKLVDPSQTQTDTFIQSQSQSHGYETELSSEIGAQSRRRGSLVGQTIEEVDIEEDVVTYNEDDDLFPPKVSKSNIVQSPVKTTATTTTTTTTKSGSKFISQSDEETGTIEEDLVYDANDNKIKSTGIISTRTDNPTSAPSIPSFDVRSDVPRSTANPTGINIDTGAEMTTTRSSLGKPIKPTNSAPFSPQQANSPSPSKAGAKLTVFKQTTTNPLLLRQRTNTGGSEGSSSSPPTTRLDLRQQGRSSGPSDASVQAQLDTIHDDDL